MRAGWNDQEPPAEWKPGMMLMVKGWNGVEHIELLGTCSLTTEWDHWVGDARETPGTEYDREGLSTDHWHWGREIVAWHPGISEHLEAANRMGMTSAAFR